MGRRRGKQMHMLIAQDWQQLSASCIEPSLIWRCLKLAGDSLNCMTDPQVNRLDANAGVLNKPVFVAYSGQVIGLLARTIF